MSSNRGSPLCYKRRRWDSNPRITVLQTVAQNSQPQEKQELTTQPKQCLQTSLQTNSENNQKQAQIDTQNLPADLAEIIDVWPELPEHIKAAIKALVQTHIQGDK